MPMPDDSVQFLHDQADVLFKTLDTQNDCLDAIRFCMNKASIPFEKLIRGEAPDGKDLVMASMATSDAIAIIETLKNNPIFDDTDMLLRQLRHNFTNVLKGGKIVTFNSETATIEQ